ncbi:hypothetical protein LY622_13755 [Halomonas sp. M5N1S17]|uniref:hypothetical protein n=1 Tax=Halomonas alkalisoli TaxID=2907158 RepID=UPI001F17F589|nr:hypothetical protein [Halomonas alkalisoli]MCE9664499.1 hypothetical protein [Halomonas alkalisoli]
MNNVTHLHGLTTAHRCLMARIQDICVDITLHTEYEACCHYSGGTHSLTASIIPPHRQEKEKGGDGSYRSEWSMSVYLPPQKLADADSLNSLSHMLNQLTARLPMPGPGPGTGGAA